MTKILWYLYFIIYLLIASSSKIKIKYLKKASKEKAYLYAYSKAQKMARHFLKLSKTKTCVIGEEHIPKETCVFIANHQAIFDGFMFLAYVNKPMGFIAKKEIEKLPLIGSWLKDINTVFIDRKNPRDSVRAISAGAENLKNGYCMTIFPEGTRSLGKEMKEFKKGSLKLALKAGVPIVPVTLEGTYNVLEVGNKLTGHDITMVFHEAIYPQNLSKEEIGLLSENIHDIIEEKLCEIKNKKRLP